MRTALYLLLALAAVPAIAGQTVWKWVDEKGVTHFSDQPVPGATKMELNSAPSPSPPPAPTNTPSPAVTTARQIGPAYSRLVVESPQQDESIVNSGGKVTVRLASTPALAPDHVMALYLDGARIQDFPANGMSYELSDVPRGSHTLKAVVTTPKGEVLQESPATTFHVRQESIAKPPVGPAMRTPGKPRASAGNKLRTSQPTYQALNGGRAQIDPRTNMPVRAQPAPTGPKN
jgi:hypothetical protein